MFIFRFLEFFLILLLLQGNNPTPQTRPRLFRICGYRRRTEIHATASCACFVRHLSDGGVGSALNQPSTTLPSVISSKLKVSDYG